MTTPSKSQTDIPSVDGLNTVTPETINDAALQYIYAVGDLDTADEAVAADEPEAPVDPIMTIMPVGEAIIIEEAPADLIWIMPSEEAYADDEVYEDVLVDELIDPIFTIMPVDEGVIIDEVILDETVDGEVIETPPEDITDLVLVDPIFTIMPVDDYIFLDDMETIPEDPGFYEEVIDVLADPETELPPDADMDPLVMAKPLIWDESWDGSDGEIIDGTGEGDLETSPEDITDLVLVDPIFTIMPVDEGIIIDEVLLDETVGGESDGEVIETPPEDITDLVLIDPIFPILPVEDYIFLDDMEITPEELGFYEEIVDVAIDPETGLPTETDEDPVDPMVMEKPFILDWSRDRGDEGNGDISFENLDLDAPEESFSCIVFMCNLTADEIVFSTEEPILDMGFTDIDAGAVTEIMLLGLPETIEFIA